MTHLESPAPARDVTHRWAAAERGGDTRALRKLLAADFLGIGPFGFVLTKEQWLARYSDGDLRNEAFDVEDITVRSYGSTVVANGVQIQRATYRGHPADGRFRLTIMLVAQQAAWSIVNVQLSSMPPQ